MRRLLPLDTSAQPPPSDDDRRAERVALAEAIAAMTPDVPQSDSTLLLRGEREI